MMRRIGPEKPSRRTIRKRTFRILVVDDDAPSGDRAPARFTRTVSYNGKAQTVKL